MQMATGTLSNQAQIIINDNLHNVVGRVCMDQTMVDIGTTSAYNGDQAISSAPRATTK